MMSSNLKRSINRSSRLAGRVVLWLCVVGLFCSRLFAQKLQIVSSQPPEAESSFSPYILILVLGLGLGALVAWLARGRVSVKADSAYKPYKPGDGSRAAKRKQRYDPVKTPVADQVETQAAVTARLNEIIEKTKDDLSFFPIFTMRSMPDPPVPETLSISDDDVLIAAVQESDVDLEEDEEVRSRALEVLASYRTQNSVESLSQMALYDLSSGIRSQALAALAHFDHPSVFESILMAFADPTREVRAAASRALGRVTFQRADAWFAIADLSDILRVRHCARAIIAAGMQTPAFARLMSRQRDAALEALGIICVLIRAGENEDLIQTILETDDIKMAKALLHAMHLTGDEQIVAQLAEAVETFEAKQEIREEIETFLENHVPDAVREEACVIG